MARSYKDWIVEISSTTGTGPYSLGGAPPGTSYFPFRQRYPDGTDTIVYYVRNVDRTKWEKNVMTTLTYGSPGADTLTRNVIESTNGDAPVSWVSGDLPLRIYVGPDSDASEIAVTGGAADERPEVSRDAAIWADTTLGWSDQVPFSIKPVADEVRVGSYEGSVDMFISARSMATRAAGAANHTVDVVEDAGWMLTVDNSAAERSFLLPSLASTPAGFACFVYGLSKNNAIILVPDGTDAIDLGSNGQNLPLPGRCRIMVWKDAATGKWQTDFDYSVSHLMAIKTAAAASEVDFTSLPYWARDLKFRYVLYAGTAGQQLAYRVSRSAAFDTGGNYAHQFIGQSADTGTLTVTAAGTQDKAFVTHTGLSGTTSEWTRGQTLFTAYNEASITGNLRTVSEVHGLNNVGNNFITRTHNWMTGGIDGVRWLMHSGTLTGTFWLEVIG